MSTTSENRDIEVLFEEVMPGYRCLVSRQADGAINLQFENLSSHEAITLPAVDPGLWDSAERLQLLCEQIAGEFLLICGATPPDSSAATEPIQVTKHLAAKLAEVILSLQRHQA